MRVATPYRFFLSLLFVLVSASYASAEDASVKTVRVPDGGIFPQAAVDARGRLHLTYVKGDPKNADIFYVSSTDGGESFTRPVRVNSKEGTAIVAGTIRGPQMAVGQGGRVHVAWMGSSTAEPKVDGKAPMLYTRLKDDGSGFEPERNLIQKYPGLDGGGSVAADEEGNVYVAWHSPKEKESEADRQVWLVRSTDEGKTFGPEVQANPTPTGVCACCGMKVFAGPKGQVTILYRSATAVVNRDMQLLVSNDYGQKFSVVATEPWKVAQCVMSTSAIAASKAGLVVAWETEQQVTLTRVSRDREKPAVAQVKAPGTGKNRKHPSVAVDSTGVTVLAWTEGTGWKKGGSLAWQLYGADGEPDSTSSGKAPGVPAWSVPAVVSLPGQGFRIIY